MDELFNQALNTRNQQQDFISNQYIEVAPDRKDLFERIMVNNYQGGRFLRGLERRTIMN